MLQLFQDFLVSKFLFNDFASNRIKVNLNLFEFFAIFTQAPTINFIARTSFLEFFDGKAMLIHNLLLWDRWGT